MRWELLFADLEARLEAADRAAVDVEIAERIRDERAAVTLGERCAGALGAEVTLTLRGGARMRGTVAEAAGNWVLLQTPAGEAVAPLTAVVEVDGLGNAAAPLSEVRQRLTFASVLRGLAESGAWVTLDTDAGTRAGRIASVGADHLDLVGDAGEVTIGLAGVRVVRAG